MSNVSGYLIFYFAGMFFKASDCERKNDLSFHHWQLYWKRGHNESECQGRIH